MDPRVVNADTDVLKLLLLDASPDELNTGMNSMMNTGFIGLRFSIFFCIIPPLAGGSDYKIPLEQKQSLL